MRMVEHEKNTKTMKPLELVKCLMERYEHCHGEIRMYYGLLAYYALAQMADAGRDVQIMEKCKDYLAQYPDHFDHPYYNFEAYRVGGNGKAWLLYKGYMPQAKEEIRKYAELTLKAPVNENGIVGSPMEEYRHRVWIDVVTAITPFMLFAGLALEEERYIDFAAEQCFKMYDLFLDETNGLLHQARGFMENPKRMSADHWGRGNGWGLIGLAELVQYLPKDSKHRAKAEVYFKDLLSSIIPYQTVRGLWKQEIPEKYAWEECTGTALILYGIGIGLRTGILEEDVYRPVFEKGIAALGAYCIDEDCATYRSCGGCLCPGEGAMKGSVEAYLTLRTPMKDEPHSYGCMMLAFVEAYKNGISEVELLGMVGGNGGNRRAI